MDGVMARSNSPDALYKHGHSIQTVKQWRTREHEAGRPSGFNDFLRAHGLCVECGGHGYLVIGVRWRDEHGIERSAKGPIADLIEGHNLRKPHDTAIREVLETWDYLYERCESCNGTGKSNHLVTD